MQQSGTVLWAEPKCGGIMESLPASQCNKVFLIKAGQSQ